MKRIAVVGGIGAGKSVVQRVLRAIGYPVYDCDSRAREIMDQSLEIKMEIARDISPDAIDDGGNIDRRCLSKLVFGNPRMLETLNAIVHKHVRRDIERWISVQQSDKCFIETAILYQSGIDNMVDEVWEVTAPREIRIQRVMRRNNLSAAEVEERIDAQAYKPQRVHPNIKEISNDENHSLLMQINKLLRS